MNNETKKTVKKLFHFLNQKEYGEIIYHHEIENILEIKRELSKYGIYLKLVKDLLIPESKILKAIPGVGYQVLKPQQVSSFVYRKYIKRTLNMYNYSSEILSFLNRDGFDSDRENEYNDVKELNNTLKNTTQNIIEKSGYYSRKDYYDNLNN